MAEKKTRKSSVAAPKTEVFAMRLDPKTKYLAEISARKHRRSLASFVEWAIGEAFLNVLLDDPDIHGNGPTVANCATDLWALDEADRLKILVTKFPDLLSYNEQLIWRVICEHTAYNDYIKATCGFKNKDIVDMELVRRCWPEIKAYALESQTAERLNAAICLHYEVPF